jgi:hypothetical protein
MSIHPDAVSDQVKNALDEVLVRKLCELSPLFWPAITLEDILLNTKSSNYPFPDLVCVY